MTLGQSFGYILISLCGLLPGFYYLYLHFTKDREWAAKELYSKGEGSEWIETSVGGIGVVKDKDGQMHFKIYRFE